MSPNQTPRPPEPLLKVEVEFTDDELADLEAARKEAGFDTIPAFIAASTRHVTRSRRIAHRLVPAQVVPGFPFFGADQLV